MKLSTRVQLYRSRAGEEQSKRLYDTTLEKLPFDFNELNVNTENFGCAHVVVCGPIEAHPLFLWHGHSGPAPFMLHAFKRLVVHYRVYAPDFPLQGGGRSDMVVFDPHRHEYGQWCLEVMRALGQLRQGAPLPLHVGISFGGSVLLDLATMAPETIRAGALVVPGSLHPDYDSWRTRLHLNLLILLPGVLYQWLPNSWTAWLMLRSVTDDPLDSEDPMLEQLKLVFRHVRIFTPGPRRFSAEQLRGCTAPMLVITAERDIFGGGTATAKRARQVLPNCTAEVLPGTKHVPSQAKLVRVNERILQFFQERAGSH